MQKPDFWKNQAKAAETAKTLSNLQQEVAEFEAIKTEDDLNIASRIMTVADVFTAVAEDRPYREGMKEERIVDILKDMANRGFLDNSIIMTRSTPYHWKLNISDQEFQLISLSN